MNSETGFMIKNKCEVLLCDDPKIVAEQVPNAAAHIPLYCYKGISARKFINCNILLYIYIYYNS